MRSSMAGARGLTPVGCERRNRIRGGGEVALAGEAGAAAGAQIVVAVADPVKGDSGRQPIGLDLAASAEGIALALHDEGWTGQMLQVCRAQLLRFFGWV